MSEQNFFIKSPLANLLFKVEKRKNSMHLEMKKGKLPQTLQNLADYGQIVHESVHNNGENSEKTGWIPNLNDWN